MTTQAGDRFTFEGVTYVSECLPLESLPKNQLPDFEEFSVSATDCWRGYIGHWTIADSQLWLDHIQASGDVRIGEEIRAFRLTDAFPDADGRVFADWFTGCIALPQGDPLPVERQMMFMLPEHERTCFIQVVNGRVINVEIRNN